MRKNKLHDKPKKLKYKINEIFDSIQGEGLFIGKPMNFIRFCSCNLNCRWCDTDFEDEEEMGIEEIVQNLNRKWTWVSLTGGEPLIEENLKQLIDILHENQFKVLLETNATIYEKQIMEGSDFISADIKPPSSGNSTWDPQVMDYCLNNPVKSQLKVVIQDEGDMEFFRSVHDKGYPNWILQPEHGAIDKLGWWRIIKTVPENVRIIPQIHKILGVK